MELRILENMTKNNSTDLKQNILDTMIQWGHFNTLQPIYYNFLKKKFRKFQQYQFQYPVPFFFFQN